MSKMNQVIFTIDFSMICLYNPIPFLGLTSHLYPGGIQNQISVHFLFPACVTHACQSHTP